MSRICRNTDEFFGGLTTAPLSWLALAALPAVLESRHVNHLCLTPVVLTESTEALTYCATQGRAFGLASSRYTSLLQADLFQDGGLERFLSLQKGAVNHIRKKEKKKKS